MKGKIAQATEQYVLKSKKEYHQEYMIIYQPDYVLALVGLYLLRPQYLS